MIGAILGGILGAGSSYLQAKNQKKTAQQALDAQNAFRLNRNMTVDTTGIPFATFV